MEQEQFAELREASFGRDWTSFIIDIAITFIGVFGAILMARMI